MKGKQRDPTRLPQQEGSRHEVRPILEATTRILEQGGLDALTTNFIAVSAGVGIGTLYQFFPNEDAILDALANTEIAAMSERVMEDAAIATTEARVAGIVRAVTATYGARRAAHRLVMAHSLKRGVGSSLPLMARLVPHLTRDRDQGAIRKTLTEADAFGLGHAVAGVLRALTTEIERTPPLAEVERALMHLLLSYMAPHRQDVN